ncbi:MAG: DUF1893 domain-containing protein [Clostridia bacterium]|nr:DUF1893 domain-containing protein [Clostridia bacterium]
MAETTLQHAKNLLNDGNYTCVAYCAEQTLTSTQRGVAPLIGWLDEGRSLDGFAVADKVIGKAAAFLHVLLGTTQIFAGVISRPALDVLQTHGVYVDCDRVVEAIINRAGDGYCPLEQAVYNTTSPTQALQKIKEKLQQLKQN